MLNPIKFFSKFIRSNNQKELDKIDKIVQKVNSFEKEISTLSENQFKDKVSEVLAIDNWLWFLALENIFTDDDSYWNKGCDYLIYFEPKSGRLFPIEHDGNEAFRPNQTLLDPFVHQNNANRPVISKLLNVPEFRQRYLSHMRTILREDFNPETMNGRIDHYVEIIQESIENNKEK